MQIEDILSHCDHTLLKQTSTFDDIKALIDDAIEYKTAAVCIPPCYVRDAAVYADKRVRICTVIGFPNGYNTVESKVFETKEAVCSGADEIDMVINIGELKANNIEYVQNEILRVREACIGKVLKVIIETCLLTDEEKIKMCKIITDCGADFIKTSTGFSSNGAALSDIELFKKEIGNNVKIKAAGGIRSIDDAEKFLNAGAERLGTSSIVNIAKEALK